LLTDRADAGFERSRCLQATHGFSKVIPSRIAARNLKDSAQRFLGLRPRKDNGEGGLSHSMDFGKALQATY